MRVNGLQICNNKRLLCWRGKLQAEERFRMNTKASGTFLSRRAIIRAAGVALLGIAAFVASRHVFERINPSINSQSIFDFEVKSLDSDDTIHLSSLRGKKAYLIVNVASECGLTSRNYDELNQLYDKYRCVQSMFYMIKYCFVIYLLYLCASMLM
jgi:hypothetical protein